MRLFACIMVLVASLLASTGVFAHASLLAVDPADGSVISAAPSTLTLDFNEQVAPIVLRLIAPDGRDLSLDKFGIDDTKLVITAPPGLAMGTYALSWRVISADGHPVGGTTIFSIGAASASGRPAASEAVDWPVASGIWIGRVLTYVGLFVGAGGVFFCRWVGRNQAGMRGARLGLLAGLLALPLDVAFQGLDALNAPIGGLGSLDVWRQGFASSFGPFVVAVASSLLLALLASGPVRFPRLLALLGLLGVGLSLAITGHAGAADPQWLTRSMVFVHAIVVAFWIGALLPLAALLRQPADIAVAPLRRFSATILPLLLLLVLAGVTLAVVQIVAPAELLSTAYGQVFVAKMVVVATLLGLAAFNRWGLTGSVFDHAEKAQGRLARSIAIELGLILAVLGIVALWRFTPPPRALIAAAAQPALLELQDAEAMAEVVITPGRAGAVDVVVQLMDAAMAPLAAAGVMLDLSNKARGIEPIERKARLGSDGNWHVDALTLPTGGRWQVGVDILVSDFKEIDLAGQVEIRP